MKIRLDRDKCAGHGQCYAVDAAMFPIDDEGFSTVTARQIGPREEELAVRGVGACPEQALLLERNS